VSCRALPCVAVRCGALRCVAVRCRALPCVAVRCRALPCVAVCCGALRCVAVRCRALLSLVRCGALRYVAVRCGALRCVAVRCGALRCVAVHCRALYSNPALRRERAAWPRMSPNSCVSRDSRDSRGCTRLKILMLLVSSSTRRRARAGFPPKALSTCSRTGALAGSSRDISDHERIRRVCVYYCSTYYKAVRVGGGG
jgi:hypothetical protein